MASGGRTSPSAPRGSRSIRPPRCRRLAIAAAAAVGGDFVGVDLLPVEDGYVVIEINGAVEFDRRYDLDGRDVYTEVANALALPLTAPVVV